MTPRRGPKPETVEKAKALGISINEMITMRQRISTALINLQSCRFYWSRVHRRLIARSVQCKRRFRLPPDAQLVGVYSHGINSADVLGDLADQLALLESAAPAATEPAGGAIATEPMPPQPDPPAHSL